MSNDTQHPDFSSVASVPETDGAPSPPLDTKGNLT